MYALPGQTLARAMQDLRVAIDAGTTQLCRRTIWTLEPNTLFIAIRQPCLTMICQPICQSPSNRTGKHRLCALRDVGVRPPGHLARTIHYWQFGDYLGLGAGAHSKLPFHDRIIRLTVTGSRAVPALGTGRAGC